MVVSTTRKKVLDVNQTKKVDMTKWQSTNDVNAATDFCNPTGDSEAKIHENAVRMIDDVNATTTKNQLRIGRDPLGE